MTQYPSPYAQPMEPLPPPPVSRTSGLAIASLVFSLIFCCPFLGLIGVLLGLFALGPTGRPGVKGRGLAIAGILIGLLVTVGWGLMTYGGYRAYQMVMGEFTKKMQEFVVDYNRGDNSKVYEWTNESFREQVSRPEFDEFMNDLRREWGNAEMLDLWEALQSLKSMPADVQQRVEQQKEGGDTALLPVPVRFEKVGLKWVVLEIDASRGDDRLVIQRFEFADYGTLPREPGRGPGRSVR